MIQSQTSAVYSQKVGGNRKDVFYNGKSWQDMVVSRLKPSWEFKFYEGKPRVN